MVKKEVFEWIGTGQKTIELRRGKSKQGDHAVFQCGKEISKSESRENNGICSDCLLILEIDEE